MNFEDVLFVVILAAKEELLVFRVLSNPSILVAADELFVVIVEFIVVIDEFKEADVLEKDALSDTS